MLPHPHCTGASQDLVLANCANSFWHIPHKQRSFIYSNKKERPKRTHTISLAHQIHKFIIGDSWLARFGDWYCISMRGKWRGNRKIARQASLLLSELFFCYTSFSCKIFLLLTKLRYCQIQIKSHSSYISRLNLPHLTMQTGTVAADSCSP